MALRKQDWDINEERDFVRTNTTSAGRVAPGAFVAAGVVNPAFPTGPQATLIVLSPVSANLAPGSTQQFAASVRDQNNNIMASPTVTWASSNTAVATVNSAGLVTAVAQGTCEIRATSGAVQSAPYVIVVGVATRVLAVTSGNAQSSAVQVALTNPLVVTLTSGGNPVVGEVISWDSDDDSAIFPATSVTDASGQAQITLTSGTFSGPHTVTVTASGAPAVTFTYTTTAAAASTITANSSTSQSALVSSAVSALPSVIVRDTLGNPKSGVTVTFAITAGGGSAGTLTPATDASGVATVGSWTTGAGAGTNTMTATVAGLTGSPVTFNVSATASAATQIAATGGTGQTTVVAGQAATALEWTVKDAGNNVVQGQRVDFAITGEPSGGTAGSLLAAFAISDASGKVTATLTTNTKVGTTSVNASFTPSGAAVNASISVTTVAGTATKLGIVTQPSNSGSSGTALQQPPVIEVLDANNNRKLTGTGSAAVVTSSVSSGNATIQAGGSGTAASGVLTLSGFTLSDFDSGANLITFASAGLTSVVSNAVTLAPPVPAALLISSQPGNAIAGAATISLTVRIVDGSGATVVGATNNVSVALTSAGGATLSGTTSLNATAGVAQFSQLGVNLTGSYTLTATATGLTSAVSSSFTISAAGATNEPAGMTQLVQANLAADTHDTGYGTTGLVRGGFKWFTSGNASKTRKISSQFSGGADGWNSAAAQVPACPNGKDDIVACVFGSGGTINAGEKSLGEPNGFPATSIKSQYIRFYTLASSNWYGEASGACKRWYLRCNSVFPAILKMDGAGTNQLNLRVTYQAPNVAGHHQVQSIQRNQWYLIEMHAVCATSTTAADGQILVWVDGVLKYRDDTLKTGATVWATPQREVYYGGSTGSTPGAANGEQFVADGDEYYVSTSTNRILVP